MEVTCPEWIRDGSISIGFAELNPSAVEALIETLRDANETDDDRVKRLLRLWDALTGDA